MSKHVLEWLNPYLDGELKGSQSRTVEAHLSECRECQAELESLQRLSGLLQQVPVPAFISPERFASQVNLRLPHEQPIVSGKRLLEIGWSMIPVGLLAAWIFVSTSAVLSDILSAANNLGLLNSVSGWLTFGISSSPDWSATLGQVGLLRGNGLNWAEWTESFTRTALPQISLQVSIALLYLSWMAIWWSRRTQAQNRQHGELLEG